MTLGCDREPAVVPTTGVPGHSEPGDAGPADPFGPARLGPVQPRNRVLMAATFEGMSPAGVVSSSLVDFHRRVAAGGVAASPEPPARRTPRARRSRLSSATPARSAQSAGDTSGRPRARPWRERGCTRSRSARSTRSSTILRAAPGMLGGRWFRRGRTALRPPLSGVGVPQPAVEPANRAGPPRTDQQSLSRRPG
jgi:hypothetical protein